MGKQSENGTSQHHEYLLQPLKLYYVVYIPTNEKIRLYAEKEAKAKEKDLREKAGKLFSSKVADRELYQGTARYAASSRQCRTTRGRLGVVV